MKLRKGVPFFTCISLPEQGSIFPKIGCDSLSGLNQARSNSKYSVFSHAHKVHVFN